jgi:hypothetical protein
MGAILNDLLPWDGSFLGTFDESSIVQRWTIDKIKYSAIRMAPPDGASTSRPSMAGIVYGIIIPTENRLPCIIDAIKPFFGIHKRGIHQLQIGRTRHLIYYIPITSTRSILWETPVSALGLKHPLRHDPDFRPKLQCLIAFCDILGLSQTGEYSFWIRPSADGYVPINTNDKITSIMKAEIYDYSILSKVLINRWIGEDLPIADIVKSMVNFGGGLGPLEAGPSKPGDLVTITTDLRNQIDQVIRHFDPNYVWYTNFIMERLTRYLLF